MWGSSRFVTALRQRLILGLYRQTCLTTDFGAPRVGPALCQRALG